MRRVKLILELNISDDRLADRKECPDTYIADLMRQMLFSVKNAFPALFKETYVYARGEASHDLQASNPQLHNRLMYYLLTSDADEDHDDEELVEWYTAKDFEECAKELDALEAQSRDDEEAFEQEVIDQEDQDLGDIEGNYDETPTF